MQFISPQIWTRHAVLPGVRAESSKKNLSECFGVNLRTVQRIWEELGESNGDYEGTTARETNSARSDKKRTPEFVEEIKTTIGNDPSNSMRAIGRDTRVSEFTQQADDSAQDIPYFSYKMRKDQQDSAPCHTSRRTLAWLSDNFSKHITPDMWPPNTPVSNPLDYYIWDEIK